MERDQIEQARDKTAVDLDGATDTPPVFRQVTTEEEGLLEMWLRARAKRREWFAGQVLAGWAVHGWVPFDSAAVNIPGAIDRGIAHAYEVADRMVKEGERLAERDREAEWDRVGQTHQAPTIPVARRPGEARRFA